MLINNLDQVFKDPAVKKIQDTLKGYVNDQKLTEEEVDNIFKPIKGDWANKEAKDKPRRGIRDICDKIKKEMFKKI